MVEDKLIAGQSQQKTESQKGLRGKGKVGNGEKEWIK